MSRAGGALPPVTHRSVLAIALPIVAANVTTPLIGLIDTAVVGQLPDPRFIGGVAVGAAIFTFLFWAFGFLRMGTTGLTAQASGAGDESETAAALARAVLIALVAGLLLIALQRPIMRAAFTLIEGSGAVETEAARYVAIRIWSAPAALANFALLGWFIGLGRTRLALALQLFLNLINAALDVFFVLGLGMETAGVALGTVIAEWSAAAAGLAIAARMVGTGLPSLARIAKRAQLARTVAVNGDIMIRTLCLLFAFTFFTAQSARFGDVTLAANTILVQLVGFVAYFLDGIAFAAEVFVGRAIGAHDAGAFRDGVVVSSLWAGVLSAVLGLILLGLGDLFIDALTVNAEVRAEARVYLLWAALVPVVGAACYQLDGIFIGATRGADMRNMALVSTAIYFAAWALLTPFGNHGLWLALIILNIARGLTLAARFPALRREAFQVPGT